MANDRTAEGGPSGLDRIRERTRATVRFVADVLRGHARSRHLDNREK
ncbi:hypothetical protein [Halobaculum rubrum]|nr:hypothetical protein [Halobaculum rubrum]QZX98989.1 hypothetical protein K6T25_12055 [Halobaculum rubrum]